MKNERPYSELHRVVMSNIAGLATDNAEKAEALVNDIIEVYEDLERLLPALDVITGESRKRDDVKAALSTLNVRSWHTAEHLNSLYSILEEEWDWRSQH